MIKKFKTLGLLIGTPVAIIAPIVSLTSCGFGDLIGNGFKIPNSDDLFKDYKTTNEFLNNKIRNALEELIKSYQPTQPATGDKLEAQKAADTPNPQNSDKQTPPLDPVSTIMMMLPYLALSTQANTPILSLNSTYDNNNSKPSNTDSLPTENADTKQLQSIIEYLKGTSNRIENIFTTNDTNVVKIFKNYQNMQRNFNNNNIQNTFEKDSLLYNIKDMWVNKNTVSTKLNGMEDPITYAIIKAILDKLHPLFTTNNPSFSQRYEVFKILSNLNGSGLDFFNAVFKLEFKVKANSQFINIRTSGLLESYLPIAHELITGKELKDGESMTEFNDGTNGYTYHSKDISEIPSAKLAGFYLYDYKSSKSPYNYITRISKPNVEAMSEIFNNKEPKNKPESTIGFDASIMTYRNDNNISQDQNLSTNPVTNARELNNLAKSALGDMFKLRVKAVLEGSMVGMGDRLKYKDFNEAYREYSKLEHIGDDMKIRNSISDYTEDLINSNDLPNKFNDYNNWFIKPDTNLVPDSFGDSLGMILPSNDKIYKINDLNLANISKKPFLQILEKISKTNINPKGFTGNRFVDETDQYKEIKKLINYLIPYNYRKNNIDGDKLIYNDFTWEITDFKKESISDDDWKTHLSQTTDKQIQNTYHKYSISIQLHHPFTNTISTGSDNYGNAITFSWYTK